DGHAGVRVEDAMLRALKQIDAGMFDDDPDLQAALLDTIAEILNNNWRSADALAPAERALAIHEGEHSADSPAVAVSLHVLAGIHQRLGNLEQAERLFDRALGMRRRLAGGDHADVAESLGSLGRVRVQLGRIDDGLTGLRESIAMYRRLSNGDDEHVAA